MKVADDVSAFVTVQSECTALAAAANANMTERSRGPSGFGASYVGLLHLLTPEPPLPLPSVSYRETSGNIRATHWFPRPGRTLDTDAP